MGGDSFRTFVVVNPSSSHGATGRRWPATERALRAVLGEDFAHDMTDGPLAATALTRDALRDGYEMIVSFGGDGTNNEVVNGFFDEAGSPIRDGAVLAVLPSGTGGDFRKTVGLVDLESAIATLRGRTTRPIDVGRTTFRSHDGRDVTRHFLNITSFGVGGVVDAYVNRSSKRLGGKATFFLAAVKAFVTYHNQPVRLRLDGGPEERVTTNNVVVANGCYFGGGMHVAPEALLDDGLFDVVVFGDLTKREYMSLAGTIYDGTHLTRPKVSLRRARVVEADSDETVLIDMDGEQPGRLPIRLEVLPSALRLKTA